MWSDRETNIDFIGHSIIADSIKELIYDEQLSPLTIGVFGDWGVGKSSVLKMVEKTFEGEGDKENLCLTFNGWLFQGYDDAKSVLMEVIIRELYERRGVGEEVKSAALSLLKKVDWFRVTKKVAGLALTTGIFGIPLDIGSVFDRFQTAVQDVIEKKTQMKREEVEGVFEEAKGFFKSGEGSTTTAATAVYAFRKEFQELLRLCKVKRLIILVDDLDRCLPNTAIEALEAIRLFLFVPGTTFIIAADENMIAYAVRRHFPDLPVTGRPLDYPRSYLEKLIQVPFRIPNLNYREVQNYIALLLLQNDMKGATERFQKLHEQRMDALRQPWNLNILDEVEAEKIAGKLSDAECTSVRLAQGVALQLTEGLSGNPRQIKRFLNTLILRHRVAKALKVDTTLNLQVLVKLMLLERFREAIYLDLMALTSRSEGGKCEALQRIEEAAQAGSELSVKGLDGEQQASKWMEDLWFVNWAKMQPSLGNVDIRPYVYISKDRSLGFSLEAELGGELGQIAADLLSASQALQIAAEKKLGDLHEHDTKRLFEFLLARSSSADWRTSCKPVVAFMKVAKNRPSLQVRVLGVFDKKPTVEMGAWVIPPLEDCITDSSLIPQVEALFRKWATDSQSLIGRASAKTLSKRGGN